MEVRASADSQGSRSVREEGKEGWEVGRGAAGGCRAGGGEGREEEEDRSRL